MPAYCPSALPYPLTQLLNIISLGVSIYLHTDSSFFRIPAYDRYHDNFT